MLDMGVFFAVLLVGFAYVWSRGDLDWVRAVGGSSTGGSRADDSVRGGSFDERTKAMLDDCLAKRCTPSGWSASDLEAIDPWIEVAPDGLADVCRVSARRARDCGSTCSTASRRSTISSRTRRRRPRSTWQPHVELIYHLSSTGASASAGVEGASAALAGRRAGPTARGAQRQRRLEHGRLARARGVRPDRASVSRAIPTCGGSSVPRIGWAIRCERITRCRPSTTGSRRGRPMPIERVDPELVEFDVHTDEMLINMGPQHPSTHGVLRLVLRTDGEVVTEVDAAHRLSAPLGREDRRESHAAAVPALHRPARLPGRHEHEPRLGAVRREAAGARRCSEKTRHLRVIMAELSRIASHLVAAGCYGLDLGSFTPFMWTLPRAREDSQPVRGGLRRPADVQLHHRRRRDGRPAAGLAGAVRGVSRPVRAGDRRFARPADEQRDFHPPHGGRRRAVAGDGHRLRLHRPGAARQRRRLGPAPRRRADLHARCTTATSSR